MQNQDSFRTEVYDLYYARVFGYVLNRVRSKADAEDITSDVFLKLLSRMDEFDPGRTGASTYVFRVMQTTLADFYRKNKAVCMPMEAFADEQAPEDDMDALLAMLDRAMDVLAEREQAVVVLHYYHGLSHKEIAGKMQLSYVNVRQICHVALKKLRKEMEKLHEE